MSCTTYALPEALYKPRCVHQIEILPFQPGLITRKLRRICKTYFIQIFLASRDDTKCSNYNTKKIAKVGK